MCDYEIAFESDTYSTIGNLNDLQASGFISELLSGDYSGRTIIELIQNGNDQIVKGIEDGGKLFFKLYDEGLLVANQGIGFKEEDCQDIRSGKGKKFESQSNINLIGKKGVGFKSVLNFTNNPVFFSEYNVEYNYRKGIKKIESNYEDKEKKQKFEEKLKNLEKSEHKNPLKFPIKIKKIDDYEFDNGAIKQDIKKILDQHSTDHPTQYSTVLYLPFREKNESDCIKKILKEFKNFESYSLMFFTSLNEDENNVDEIKFIDGRKENISDTENHNRHIKIDKIYPKEEVDFEEEHNYEVEIYQINDTDKINTNDYDNDDNEYWCLYRSKYPKEQPDGINIGIKLKK